MDLYGDDIDSLLEKDALNENIREDNICDDENQGNADENAENDGEKNDEENDAPIPVEPKKRAVRNPQLRLNVERLKSERGIHTVEDYFKDIKFLGKGYEKQDLNNVMKRLEHWAHRLYPNYNFDDFLATTEKLGKKKQIQTFMNRYRQGLLEMVVQRADENNDEDDGVENDDVERGIEPIDELDEIIDQQIQNYSVMPPKTPGHDKTFDSIRSSVVTTPKFMGRVPAEVSTPLSNAVDGIRPIAPSPARLSSEQLAKIAENRRLAQERLKAKREALLQQQTEPPQLSFIEEESISEI